MRKFSMQLIKIKNPTLINPRFSRRDLIVFGLVFALIGGYAIYKGFAAPTERVWDTAADFNAGVKSQTQVDSSGAVKLGQITTGGGGVTGTIPTDPNFKVAFIGDTDDGTPQLQLNQLIKQEGAQLVLHQGDFSYASGPTTAWVDNINNTLGADFPYLGSDGNHDTWSLYTPFFKDRLSKMGLDPNLLNSDSYSVTYKGLKMVFSKEGGNPTFVANQLASDNSIWKICSWHKNQRATNVASKSDEQGWGDYEECRKGGAIIAQGHSHTYSRSKNLINFQTQTLDSNCPDDATTPDVDNCVSKGAGFFFDSSIGKEARAQNSTWAAMPYWAKVYTSTQGAKTGALFITFNVDGNPKKAKAYYKNISNQIIDDFTIMAAASDGPSTGYASSGTITLSHDAGTVSTWSNLTSVEDKPVGTSVALRSRTSNDKVTWSSWVAKGQTIANGRYIEVEATLSTTDNTVTPSLDKLNISYEAASSPLPGAGDTTVPAVSVTAPASGSTVSDNITITAAATDDIGVVGVQFKVDGSNVGEEDTSPPYSATWDTATAANGNHNLLAIARDAAGNTKTSATVTVTVDNSAISSTSTSGTGIWLSPAEIQVLPMSGSAWSAVLSAANSSWGSANLGDNNSNHDVLTLAGALVASRTGDPAMRNKTITGLQSAMVSPLTRTLELARGLQTYVIAADIIDYRTPEFENWLKDMLDRPIPGRVGTGLYNNALKDSTNWGGHERASCIAAALYLGDTARLDELTRAYREYIGENVSSKTLTYQSTNWHADATNKAGVNRLGSRISGQDVSGVLPEDWRRGSEFAWPPVPSGYMWEGMQGFVVSAVLLHRAGKVTFNSGNNVLVRAMEQLMNPVNPPNPGINYPPASDDAWISWLINFYAGTSYPRQSTSPGKNMGYTDWTHATGTPPPSDTTPPTVSITSPAAGSTHTTSPITLSATATDNVNVVGVQFKLNCPSSCGLIGSEDTSAPYSASWNTSTLQNGTHTIHAQARDAAGNLSNLASITVTVNNATTPPADTTPPSVPAGLRSTAVTANSISLAWNVATDTGGSGVAGYKIYRAGSLISSTTLLNYTDSDLTPSTSYSYTVSAYDNAGNESTKSSVFTKSTDSLPPPADTTPPSVPAGLRSTAVTANSISLAWNVATDTGGSGIEGYKLYRGGVLKATLSTPEFIDTGLTPSTSYSYTVSAYDKAGNESAKSSVLSRSTSPSPPQPDVTPPTAPSNLRAGAAATPMTLSLAWNAATDTGGSGVAGYKIYRNGTAIDTVPSLSYMDNRLTPSTSYSYTVSAYDKAGNESAQTSALSQNTTALAGQTNRKRGDVNRDNKVDITDLSILLSKFRTNHTDSDLDQDGNVNIVDLSILLSSYGS